MRRTDHLLLIGLGGAAGATIRWVIGESIAVESFPWHTLLVNVVGCAALALIAARVQQQSLQRLLATGFCGGLTTFSTFSVEIVELLDRDKIGTAVGYFVSSLVLGLIAYVTVSRVLENPPRHEAVS